MISGYRLVADQGTAYAFVMGVASGEIGEEVIAAFFRDHIEPIKA